MPDKTFDVVIIGGGVMGCSVAAHLAAMAGPGTRIAVIERDPSYRACAATRSAGGVRQQFSTPECIRMSQATVAYIENPVGAADSKSPPLTGGETQAPVAFGWREQGYLLLASEAGAATLAENVAVQRAYGAATVLLDPVDLGERFSWLGADGVAAGSFGASGEGWLDPALLLQHLKAEARARGVTFVTGEVAAIVCGSGLVTAVALATGERILAGAIVNAAGPQAGAVARLAGVALPVEPRKRFVFVFDCRDAPAALASAPLVVDPSGVWFRPEGRQFICGVSPLCDAEEPDPADLGDVDYDVFQDRVWPALAARVPAFEAIKLTGAWAGHYDYNSFDQNAVVGPHDEMANFHFCTGFSGHGLQHAIAAGRAVAEHIVHGRYTTLDLARLGFDRVRQGTRLVEKNVI